MAVVFGYNPMLEALPNWLQEFFRAHGVIFQKIIVDRKEMDEKSALQKAEQELHHFIIAAINSQLAQGKVLDELKIQQILKSLPILDELEKKTLAQVRAEINNTFDKARIDETTTAKIAPNRFASSFSSLQTRGADLRALRYNIDTSLDEKKVLAWIIQFCKKIQEQGKELEELRSHTNLTPIQISQIDELEQQLSESRLRRTDASFLIRKYEEISKIPIEERTKEIQQQLQELDKLIPQVLATLPVSLLSEETTNKIAALDQKLEELNTLRKILRKDPDAEDENVPAELKRVTPLIKGFLNDSSLSEEDKNRVGDLLEVNSQSYGVYRVNQLISLGTMWQEQRDELNSIKDLLKTPDLSADQRSQLNEAIGEQEKVLKAAKLDDNEVKYWLVEHHSYLKGQKELTSGQKTMLQQLNSLLPAIQAETPVPPAESKPKAKTNTLPENAIVIKEFFHATDQEAVNLAKQLKQEHGDLPKDILQAALKIQYPQFIDNDNPMPSLNMYNKDALGVGIQEAVTNAISLNAETSKLSKAGEKLAENYYQHLVIMDIPSKPHPKLLVEVIKHEQSSGREPSLESLPKDILMYSIKKAAQERDLQAKAAQVTEPSPEPVQPEPTNHTTKKLSS